MHTTNQKKQRNVAEKIYLTAKAFRRNAIYAALAGTAMMASAHAADATAADESAAKVTASSAEGVIQESKVSSDSAAKEGSSAGRGRALGAVVVTAQKRTQNLQEVPVAITAIRGDAVREKAILLSTDVERLVPNLSAEGGGRSGKPRWFLRGIGTNDPNQNQDGPLSIYVDEVVVGYQSSQSFPLYDLERVEVLRGPQGTLWGKNNTGGAIHYISKKPSFTSGGYTKLTYSPSDEGREIEAAYGGAIVEDVLAGRFSFYQESAEGYAKNEAGDDLGASKYGPSTDDVNVRVQFLANITSNLDAHLILSTRRLNGGDSSPSYPVGATTDPLTELTVVNPSGAWLINGKPFTPSYGSDPDYDDDYFDGTGSSKVEFNNATLKFNWQLGDNTLTSISAYNTREGNSFSLVSVPLESYSNRSSGFSALDTEQVTQELRLTSPQDQRLSWILGAYYYDLTAHNRSRTARFDFAPSEVSDPTYPAPANYRQYSLSSWDQDSESKAVFGNARFCFTDDLSLIVGLRQTWEEKEITISSTTYRATHFNYLSQNGWYLPGGIAFTAAGLNVQPTVVGNEKDWSEFTWDVTPEYRFSPNVLGYGRIAKGFRSGGFNSSINNGQVYETDPETLIAYELGLKTSLFDDRLTLNTALFHYDIENIALNIQRAFWNSTTSTWTTSALGQSDGQVTGIEFEADSQVTSNWHLGGSLGYLQSKYTDFLYNIGGAGPFDASGNSFYRTPELSFRVDTDYTIPFSFGDLILSTDWSYRSKIYHNATVQHDPRQETPGYWIGNVRARYAPSDRAWEVAAYANNVLDEVSIYLRQIANPNSGTQPNSFSQARSYGVSVTWNF